MTYSILYTGKAKDDLRAIADFIALDDIDRAIAYVQKIRRRNQYTVGFSTDRYRTEVFVLSDKTCKVLIIDEDNAIYCIDETTKVIEIQRILNSAILHDFINV